jgi:hypothetical protein
MEKLLSSKQEPERQTPVNGESELEDGVRAE